MTANPQNQPPLSNKGGNGKPSPSENPLVACHLDWMTYTVGYKPGEAPEEAIRRALPGYAEFGVTEGESYTIRGYDSSKKLGIGTVCWHSERRDMKIAVQLTGEDWLEIDKVNIPPEAIVAYALDLMAKITRIDFAVDLYQPADPNQLYEAWQSGRATTQARRAGVYESLKREDGQVIRAGTVYIGHASSLKQVRVYDKAKEQGQDGTWFRVEYIARKEAAIVLALAIAQQGVVDAGRAALRDFVDCDLDWWKTATEGRAVHLAPITRKETDTDRWLLDDVLPILERQIDANVAFGDTTLLKAVYKIVHKERKGLKLNPDGESISRAKDFIKGWGVEDGKG